MHDAVGENGSRLLGAIPITGGETGATTCLAGDHHPLVAPCADGCFVEKPK